MVNQNLFYYYFVLVWTIISVLVALGGGITLYIIYIRSNKKFTGFLKVAHDFLTFKTLLLEEILKISYLVLAIFITLYSITAIYPNPLIFLVILIGGNCLLRIIYELSILLIKICKNTTEINSKLKK